MLETQFILQNIHFLINILAAFVFFCVGWLYFDTWMFKKTLMDGLKVIGYALISLSFLIHSTIVEPVILTNPIFGPDGIYLISLIAGILGLILIAVSLLLEGVQKVVHYKVHGVMLVPMKSSIILYPLFMFPFLSGLVGFLYLRRATVGLENHLKPVSLSFFLLSVSHLFSLSYFFRDSSDVAVSSLTAPFGFFWITENIFLVLSIIIIGRWVFQYLLKRIQTQLYIISVLFILTVFLISTIVFTSFMLKNIQAEQLNHLGTDINVLNYAVETKKAGTLSDAQMVSHDPEIIRAITGGDTQKLREAAENLLMSKKQSFITIISGSGQVLMRSTDPENTMDSMSGDRVAKKVLGGESFSTVTVKDGVMAPVVCLLSAVPVGAKGDIIGAVMVGTYIDNTFVDDVKQATGLDISVYSANIRSATTFIAPDGKSRWVGIKEENSEIKKTVLESGAQFAGSADILNITYLAAYAPLKNEDGTTVGMLFVGKEQFGVYQSAYYMIQLTFMLTAVLLILSLFPAYLFSKFLSDQLE